MTGKQSGHGGSIRVAVEPDNVAVITMDRGENRMNDEFVDQMNATLDEVLREPAVKALITTGAGKFYSNGYDVQWLKGMPDYFPALRKRAWNIYCRLLTFPMPTVAVLNGHTFAGGGVISLSHDYRVMRANHGWWCMNEAHIGVKYSSVSGILLLRDAPVLESMLCAYRTKLFGKGARTIHDAVAFGRRFSALEAKNAGIVDEICESADLMSTARSLIKSVMPEGRLDRSFVEYTKKQLYCDVLSALEKDQNLSLATSHL